MDTSVSQNRGTAAGQEAVIVTESAREGVCHIICLVMLLLDGILTTSNFRRQDPCMLSDTHADAALAWSLARLSTVPTTDGIRMAGRLPNTAVSPVRALRLRIVLDLLPETMKTLISDTREATSRRQRNARARTTSNPRSLLAVVVLQLMKTRLMHRLANLVSVLHSFPPPLLCSRRRLLISHHKSLQMAPAEGLRSLGRLRHLL
jgi:hypothetical protein